MTPLISEKISLPLTIYFLSDSYFPKYSLDAYPAGETLQVRISFISDGDGDVGEGFYLDDFNVEYVTMIEEYTDVFIHKLLEICPSPCRKALTIRINDPAQIRTSELTIYDASGRSIAEIPIPNNATTPCIITWNGMDKSGRQVPAGVYFVGLKTDNSIISEKVIMLR